MNFMNVKHSIYCGKHCRMVMLASLWDFSLQKFHKIWKLSLRGSQSVYKCESKVCIHEYMWCIQMVLAHVSCLFNIMSSVQNFFDCIIVPSFKKNQKLLFNKWLLFRIRGLISFLTSILQCPPTLRPFHLFDV